uniref:Uncharacterized protein n=1 Tax=Anguilla anguilla TaxID=7936 RepID=A0A0E9XXA1_ANGAN
MVNLFFSESL